MSDTPSQPAEQDENDQTADHAGMPQGRNIRIGAVIALAIAIGFIVWAFVGSGGDDAPDGAETTATGAGPVAVSQGGLATLVGVTGQPVYWVGPRKGMLYEIQQVDGKTFVRYLPPGASAGVAEKLLTVGTYSLADAYSVTKSHASSEGAIEIQVEDGGVAFATEANPTGVYVAYPDSDYQIEVYDPTPGVARGLVERGALRNVPPAPSTQAQATTPGELRRLSTVRSQPIYWAGPASGTTLELLENAEGWIYVRYLPDGVEAGDPEPQRTIGTYPFSDAYEQTRALADKPGVTLVELDDGGIGVFSEEPDATQGYVAYPDSDFQVEVFDPTPGAAADLIESGKIVPVG